MLTAHRAKAKSDDEEIDEEASAEEPRVSLPAAAAVQSKVAATAEGEVADKFKNFDESSVYHGTELRDYLGRSYLHPPVLEGGINLMAQGESSLIGHPLFTGI